MTFVQILILIFVIFLCVYEITNRVCECKEEKYKRAGISNMFNSAWEAFINEQSRNAETETGNREE